MLRTRHVLVIALALLFAASTASAAFVWVEAESGDGSKLLHNPWWDGLRPDGLSEKDVAASFSETGQATAEIAVPFTAPETATYTLWVRLASGGTGYDYRLDDGPRARIDVQAARNEDNANRRTEGYEKRFRDERNLAIDGATDARYYAWVNVGPLELSKGEHTITFSLGGTESDKRFGAVDAFVLTTEGFEPNGPFKPGETNPNEIVLDADAMWSFEPERDPLSGDALFDLRSLNEKTAGEHGFIGLSDDGMSFVRGDGQPIRFWGGTDYTFRTGQSLMDYQRGQIERFLKAGDQERADAEKKRLEETRAQAWDDIRHHAQFLAKRGVNVARWHGQLPRKLTRQERDAGEMADLADIDESQLDQAFKLVASMKEAGIYSILSPFWGSHTNIEPGWDLPTPNNGNLSALVFFVPEVQGAYKAWLKELYTRPNPYTGVALKDEPAVAIIQLQNEDSMLFYTMQSVHGEAEKLLQRQFADWLVEKYGSLDAARKAWSDYEYAGDDWDNDLPSLFIVWEFTHDAMDIKGENAGFRARRADQLQFFGEVMYDFNHEIARYLREDLGCKQLINAGNWRSCDPILVDDVERYSYTANEVIGKNHYFDALHTGRTRGWQIMEDHIYTDVSATRDPRKLPTCIKQPIGHPFIIPESLWVPPNKYAAESPMIVASQQCLNGVDTFYWFANGEIEWNPAVSGDSLTKWSYATPMMLGQFPAAALVFRKGYLKEGEPVVVERRSLEGMWKGESPIVAESAAYDPNRDEGDFAPEVKLDSPVDPLAFLVGPVHVEYGGNPAKTHVADYGDFIDRDDSMIHSNTGEIAIDYDNGLYSVNAPKVKAAAGFLADPIDFGDVRLDCGNDYASIAVVSLDDRPLAESEKVLVQCGTFQRPTGWKVEEVDLVIADKPTTAYRIMDRGANPWQIRKLDADLAIKNAGLTKAIPLDANGLPLEAIPLERDGDFVRLTLPSDKLYVVLTK